MSGDEREHIMGHREGAVFTQAKVHGEVSLGKQGHHCRKERSRGRTKLEMFSERVELGALSLLRTSGPVFT